MLLILFGVAYGLPGFGQAYPELSLYDGMPPNARPTTDKADTIIAYRDGKGRAMR